MRGREVEWGKQKSEHDSLDEGDGSGDGKKWMDTEYVLEVEPTVSADALDVKLRNWGQFLEFWL